MVCATSAGVALPTNHERTDLLAADNHPSSRKIHSKPPKEGLASTDASEHRQKLERRLQAQLKDGSRSKDVKRMSDPLVRHLIRVAGNPSYRSLRQSVIVTGKTLICELLSAFPCRRLALRRRSLAELQASLPCLRGQLDFTLGTHNVHSVEESRKELPGDSSGKTDLLRTRSPLNAGVETHYVSNRILRKAQFSMTIDCALQAGCLQVAGFHSYDDGCIAEVRMPEPADNFGDIRLLLCLGRLPLALGHTEEAGQRSTTSCSTPGALDSGTAGTLLRTAAALQWQGAWILPSCPDIFNPLAIRASQGALFWLPYRRGGIKELVQFCRARGLAICVPHVNGIPVNTANIFEERKKKGVCLVLDSYLQGVAAGAGAQAMQLNVEHERRGNSAAFSDMSSQPRRKRIGGDTSFKSDIILSLGNDVAPAGSMPLLHPVTVASLLLYHTKQAHFPNVQGSPYLFSVRQKS